MAQRRMLSNKVIDTDCFLDMPITSRLLYYDLNLRADDDGFVASPKKICKMIGCSDDDLKILISKRFIVSFESGVIVIRHWRVHNLIRADRYNETEYKHEKSLLSQYDGVYELEYNNTSNVIPCVTPNVIPSVHTMGTTGKVRLGKDSIDKYNLYIVEVLDYLNQKINSNYRATSQKTKLLITARLKEGFEIEDFKTVIDKKVNEWSNTDMAKYLRPETLFGTKFESYLNQIAKKSKYEAVDEWMRN